jgi:ATP diphosphatase
MERGLDATDGRWTAETLGLEPAPDAARVFGAAVGIMARLRTDCPWDREQTFDSIRKHTIEEAYEVLDAIERRDWAHLEEELGDLLLQVLFYAEMGSELSADAGRFDIAGVIETLNQKLIRRHPHVFGAAASSSAGNLAVVDAEVDGSATKVLANWEQIKVAEKAGKGKSDASLLDGVQRAQPALAEASKLGSKAAKVGFDWPGWRDLLAKVEEETAELVAAVEASEQQISSGNESQKSKGQAEVESELGDLLFTVVNLGRHLGVDAEMALRGTNARFRDRFRRMERVAGKRELAEHAPEELEALWSEAKVHLSGGKG